MQGESNIPEARFRALADEKGWTATKRGWPDFLVDIGGVLVAVEIKPRATNGTLKQLKTSQVTVLNWLSDHGIPCYVSDGTTVEPYNETIHGRRSDPEPSRTQVPTKRRSAQTEADLRGIPVWVVHRERALARKTARTL